MKISAEGVVLFLVVWFKILVHSVFFDGVYLFGMDKGRVVLFRRLKR
jgi:hypothetical protein